MPTYKGDFRRGYQFAWGLQGAALVGATTGTGVLMPLGDGLSSAIILLGTVGVGTIQIEESDVLGSGYTAVPDGLYTYATTEDNTVVALTYQRSKKYLRVVVTPTGASDVAVAFIETKKTYVG